MLVIAYSRVSDDELRHLRLSLDLAKVSGYSLLDVSTYEDYKSLSGKPLIVIGASLSKKIAKDIGNGFGIIDKPSKAIAESGFAGFWKMIEGYIPSKKISMIDKSEEIDELGKSEIHIPAGKTIKILTNNCQIVIYPDEKPLKTGPFDISLSEFLMMKEFIKVVPDSKWILLQ